MVISCFTEGVAFPAHQNAEECSQYFATELTPKRALRENNYATTRVTLQTSFKRALGESCY